MKTNNISLFKLLVGLLAVVLSIGATAQLAGTFDSLGNVAITSLPYTISEEGCYYLESSLNYDSSTGAAILIQADNVVLDMQGFKIENPSTLSITRANAIEAHGRSNISIKNGIIRGFWRGIYLTGPSSSYDTHGEHVIDNLGIAQVPYAIEMRGHGNIIRNNHLSYTESSSSGSVYAMNLWGPHTRVINNDIIETVDPPDNYINIGIYLRHADNSVVENNRITRKQNGSVTTYGVYCTITDNIILIDNRVVNYKYGFYLSRQSNVYARNYVVGATTAFMNGIDGGDNFSN